MLGKRPYWEKAAHVGEGRFGQSSITKILMPHFCPPRPPGVPFPKNFQQVCTKILTRLFRVFVHVYIHHFDSILSMGAEAHVNTCYKHFYYFIREFSLVDQRELEPLVRPGPRCPPPARASLCAFSNPKAVCFRKPNTQLDLLGDEIHFTMDSVL